MTVPFAVPAAAPVAVPAPGSANGSLAAKTHPPEQQQTARYDGSALSVRDRAIVEAVETFRQLTSKQIERLFFADGAPASRDGKTRRALRRLSESGELKRIEQRVIGGWASGSQGFTYTVPSRDPQSRIPHTWAIAELYTRLVEAHRRGQCQLLDFRPEAPVSGFSFIPDAQVKLELANGTRRRIWVEVDNTKSRIADKIRAYEKAEGAWKQDKFPAILFTARDAQKLGTIQRAIAASTSSELFRVVPFNEAIERLVT